MEKKEEELKVKKPDVRDRKVVGFYKAENWDKDGNWIGPDSERVYEPIPLAQDGEVRPVTVLVDKLEKGGKKVGGWITGMVQGLWSSENTGGKNE